MRFRTACEVRCGHPGLAVLSLLLVARFAGAQGMQSAHFSVPQLVENNGSGFRAGQAYQLTSDTISSQPVETSTSTGYILQGRPLVTVDTDKAFCGVYVNANAPVTNIAAVSLSLVCGHASGCTNVQLSNNGVGWSAPASYATAVPWTLVSNDGTRTVFARYQNGLGNWSGVCSDSIVLDRTAPGVSISPIGGTFMSTQSVALTSSEPATIKYTLDGSDPTTSPTALIYSSPVAVAVNATVKAFAVDTAGNAGAVSSQTYEICTGNNLSVSGKVMDATVNKPMPLVRITLNTGQYTDTTPQGLYAFTGLARGWYSIVSVTSPVAGFVTYQQELKLCQSSLTKDINLTRDATVFGSDTNSGYSSDGVNTSTGNFAYKMADLAIPGRGPSVVFERAYNSQDAVDGPLGYGWTWNYNTSHSTGPGGELVVRWGDGKIEVWAPDGSGGYTPMYGVFSTLVKNPDTTFTLRRKDRIEYRFNATGRLAQIADEYGNKVIFAYSGSRITTITDTAGRTISLSYDANSRITNVLDPIGRSVSFAYDGAGNMVTSTDLGGQSTSYTYDTNHQMKSLTDPKGNAVMTLAYDTSRRVVVSQRDALGGETRYVYDAPNRTTTILDAMGNTSYHHFDDLLRLIREDDPRGFFATYVYNARGNMESVTDKRGNVTSFTYDDNGNVLTKTEPLGRVTTATYDAASNPLTKTDARGYSQVFAYDPGNGNLVTAFHCGPVPAASCATDPSVTRTTYTYDPVTGKVATVTEAAGHPTLERTTTSQYDIAGNQVAVIDALGNTSTFTYDGVGRKLAENHPLGRATAYEYDAMDRLLTVTDALGGQAQFTYDANGNKTEHLDARLNRTTFAYDAKDRLVSTTDPLGHVETYTYDALDRRNSVTNPRGATSTVVYDALGNVLQEIDALGSTVQHEYDANGNRTATVDAKGNRITFAYDALNRLVSTTDPLGHSELYEYDLNGNKVKATDAQGSVTTSIYDAFNRQVLVTDPLGNTTINTHDALGRLSTVTNARGYTTNFRFDKLDRVTEIVDGAGGLATASYDALGNRISVADPNGGTTFRTYDALNRMVSETDALGRAVINAFDAVGNLISVANADGTSTFSYDASNRLSSVTYPDSTSATYTYDANGNRTGVTDSAGTTSFSYDILDRPSSVTDPFNLTVDYTYDPNGNRTSTRYPGNRPVSFYFDELDRLVQVTDWGGVNTTYTYSASGRLSQQFMGNGATVTYSYDDAGRLLRKEDRSANGAVIADYVYILDENGNRTGLSCVQPVVPETDIADSIFSHNGGNELVTNNSATYTYDGKGNRALKVVGSVTTQYAYDYNNRLTTLSEGANVWEYKYSSDGKRLSSRENGTETRFLLDLVGGMESVLAELTASNEVATYYIHGDGLLYAVDGATGARRYFHFDPLGSTVAITDSSGTISAGYAYSPFGEPAGEEGSDPSAFTFVGKVGVMRESNGLYFMRARYYDPETKRFLSVDPEPGAPELSQGLNPYSYVQNNPVLGVDPTGQVKWGLLAIGLGEVALGVAGVALMGTGVGAVVGATLAMSGGIQGVADVVDAFREQPRKVVNPVEVFTGIGAAIVFKSEKAVEVTQDLTGLATSSYGSVSGAVGMITKARLAGKTWRLGEGLYHASDLVMEGISQEYDRYQSSGARGPKSSVTLNSSSSVAIRSRPASSAAASAATQKSASPGAASGTSGGAATVTRRPKAYLSVAGYASNFYKEEFSKILDPGFLDSRTRSFVEMAVAQEISDLSTRRYGYREGDSEGKRKAKERRASDVAGSASRLYAQLVSALSKHDVIVRDMSELPRFSTGGIRKAGVYGGN